MDPHSTEDRDGLEAFTYGKQGGGSATFEVDLDIEEKVEDILGATIPCGFHEGFFYSLGPDKKVVGLLRFEVAFGEEVLYAYPILSGLRVAPGMMGVVGKKLMELGLEHFRAVMKEHYYKDVFPHHPEVNPLPADDDDGGTTDGYDGENEYEWESFVQLILTTPASAAESWKGGYEDSIYAQEFRASIELAEGMGFEFPEGGIDCFVEKFSKAGAIMESVSRHWSNKEMSEFRNDSSGGGEQKRHCGDKSRTARTTTATAAEV